MLTWTAVCRQCLVGRRATGRVLKFDTLESRAFRGHWYLLDLIVKRKNERLVSLTDASCCQWNSLTDNLASHLYVHEGYECIVVDRISKDNDSGLVCVRVFVHSNIMHKFPHLIRVFNSEGWAPRGFSVEVSEENQNDEVDYPGKPSSNKQHAVDGGDAPPACSC